MQKESSKKLDFMRISEFRNHLKNKKTKKEDYNMGMSAWEIKKAKEEDRVIDVTHGRKTKSVLWLDNGTVYLSSVSTATLTNRMQEDLQKRE